MKTERKESDSSRRNVLKGVGVGALALPLVTESATARQGSCSLRVDVRPVKGSADNPIPRDTLTDNFRAQIDVSGLSAGESELAVMVIPLNPDGAFVDGGMRASHTTVDWQNGYVVSNDDWTPGGPIFSWPSGTYRLYAAVAEGGTGDFGTAVSSSFTIQT